MSTATTREEQGQMSQPRGPGLRAESSLRVLFASVLSLVALLFASNAWAGGLTISPPSATVAPLGTQAFTASGGSGLTWSLSTNASGGNITAAGLYTAGATGGVTDVVQVTASPVGDAAAAMTTANVMVTSSALTISPTTATVAAGGMQTFTASGGTGPYTWTITTDGSGGATVSGGAYTAGTMAGTDVVTVTDSKGATATATVTVTAAMMMMTDAGPPTGVGTSCTTSATCIAGLTCVDAVCCSTACTGQCQACNAAGSMGTCVTVSGPPVGTRAACPQSDPNNVCTSLACDGTNATTCTVFVGSTMTCGVPSCIDGVGTPGAICEADGGCQMVTPTNCGLYACVSDQCATTCTDDAECSVGNFCNVTTGKCIKQPPVEAGTGNSPDAGVSGRTPLSTGCASARGAGDASPFVLLTGLLGWGLYRRRRRA